MATNIDSNRKSRDMRWKCIDIDSKRGYPAAKPCGAYP